MAVVDVVDVVVVGDRLMSAVGTVTVRMVGVGLMLHAFVIPRSASQKACRVTPRGGWPPRPRTTIEGVAVYEYVCRACDTSFELRRAMSDADSRVTCPQGHADVRRRLSVFAAVGSGGSEVSPAGAPAGGCCGGACGCGR